MGLLSNKISRDDLKPGDHIYSWRSYIYSHHGIYIGDGKVIHFTRGDGLEMGTGTFLDKIIVSSVPNHGDKNNPCLDCGEQKNLDGVICSCLDCFLSGGNLYLFQYNVSKAIFVAKQRGGTCTIASSDEADEVVLRAEFLLSSNGFGRYDLLENNCEDFAIYCKTGLVVLSITKMGCSGQANLVSAASGFVSSTLNAFGVRKGGEVASMASPALVFSAASNALTTSLGLVVTGVGCMALAGYGNYCIGRLVYDVGVRKDVRKVPVEELVVVIAAMNGTLDKNNIAAMNGTLDNNNNNNCKMIV